MNIREIVLGDNADIRHIIQSCIMEHGAPKEGTAYSDAATQSMYATYQKPRAAYFVLLDEKGNLMGGAGVAQLDNSPGNIAELQKMYFLPAARGKGYGKKMMHLCLDAAKVFGFNKIYLETMDNMFEAQGLYKHAGFKTLDAPLGNTGHYSCPVQMIRNL